MLLDSAVCGKKNSNKEENPISPVMYKYADFSLLKKRKKILLWVYNKTINFIKKIYKSIITI